MKFDDLKEYFDLFIIEHLPHKNKDLYQQISNFLLDYYYNDTYESIPEAFKLAFEQQIIPPEFYNYLLLSNGFPDYIVEVLTLEDKFILLRSFMDFNVYKGTLYSLQKVSDTFTNVFNVYELFIDKDETNTWVFKPYLVYKNPEIDTVLTEALDWDRIVKGTKHFLIDRDTLNSSNMLLPIKTNLIMLDYNNDYTHNHVTDIYTSTILNHFKNSSIVLYFGGSQYKTNFLTFYILWYYILNKLYDVTYPDIVGNFIYYDYLVDSFPIDLSELLTIKTKYDAINDQAGCRSFQETYLNIFKTYVNNTSHTFSSMLAEYEYLIPADLFDYINTRISQNQNTVEESNYIITELYNSLITWFYSLQSDYDTYKYFFQVFASQLPLIRSKVEDSVTYLLINHLKPYHVEIVLNDHAATLTVNDKFNNLYLDYLYSLQYNLMKATAAHQGHTLVHDVFLNIMESAAVRSSAYTQNINLITQLFTNILAIDADFKILTNNQTMAVISDSSYTSLNFNSYSNLTSLIENNLSLLLHIDNISSNSNITINHQVNFI